jgi:hemerythrin-like domain-containing protein
MFVRQTNVALDSEHQGTLDLMGRVERALTHGAADDAVAPLMASLVQHLEHDVPVHFGFEENDLFPILIENGAGDLAHLLAEEHVTIVAVVSEVTPLARRMAKGELDAAGVAALKRSALELAARLTDHIDKETKALLPVLEDILDDEADRTLSFAHAAA